MINRHTARTLLAGVPMLAFALALPAPAAQAMQAGPQASCVKQDQRFLKAKEAVEDQQIVEARLIGRAEAAGDVARDSWWEYDLALENFKNIQKVPGTSPDSPQYQEAKKDVDDTLRGAQQADKAAAAAGDAVDAELAKGRAAAADKELKAAEAALKRCRKTAGI